jgi:hypothetical protein
MIAGMKAAFIFALLIASASFTSVAQLTSQQPESPPLTWAPPSVEMPSELPQATVPNTIVTRITVSGYPITLEQTLLESVGRRMGVIAGHRGDAGDYLAWLCFYGRDAVGIWGLWLTSGEIDGPMIGGFQWQRLPADARMDGRCKLLDTSHRPSIELPIALHLGMSESQVEALVGKPSSKYRDTSIYVHEHSLKLHGEQYSADNSLYLSYRSGALWTVLVNYTISS